MDLKKLTRLRQLRINQPCPEDWDAMEGDERRRFCSGCGCYVNNLSEMSADEAESLLQQTGRVCTRVLTDPRRGILTKDGWVSRVLTSGAVAAAMAGCQTATTGEAVGVTTKPDSTPVVDDGVDLPTGPTNPSPPIMGEIAVPMNEPLPTTGTPGTEPETRVGRAALPDYSMGDAAVSPPEATVGKIVEPE
ncbi:MAG: hypothetical protein KF812_11215 [Fimbriimonadaceae bacterium]|nr:hypothetical protein [Fimbriimonadaceae bacterium]